MATVSASAITRLWDCESTKTLTNIGSGGTTSNADADLYYQATKAFTRATGTTARTDYGFTGDHGSGVDMSAANTHVGMWVTMLQVRELTAMKIRHDSTASTTPGTNYKTHTVPSTELPVQGGWLKVWVDVSRTAEASSGSFSAAAARHFGVMVSCNAIAGTAKNLALDTLDYTTTGLSLTGTTGLWSDFVAFDQDTTTNRYGIATGSGGVVFSKGRLTLGTASSLVFNDSNFTVVFPQQALVSDTFMGVTCDLQHASTNIDWTSGVISSPGTKKGDLVITGTAGDFDAVGCSFNGLRLVTMTSKATFDTCAFNSCGQITLGAGTLTKCVVNKSSASSALLTAAPADIANVTGCTFISAGTGHAIEITGTAANITLDNTTFTGYSGTSTNAAVYVNIATGSMNITISGGTDITGNIRTAGCAVTVVVGARTVKAVAVDTNGAAVTGTNVFLRAAAGGNLPSDAAITSITRSGTTATVTFTVSHNLATNDQVLIAGITDKTEDNKVHTVTVTGTTTCTFTTTDSGSTNYTGTKTGTFVFLKGSANSGTGSNEISMSRSIPATQPVTGWIRKSTLAGGTRYKQGALAGSVSTSQDTTLTGVLIEDE